MLVAVLATWFQPAIVHHGWIVVAIAAGFVVGVPLSRVPLTAVPQRTALSHAFGGLAAGLVGTAEYFLWRGGPAPPEKDHLPLSALAPQRIPAVLTFSRNPPAPGGRQEGPPVPPRPPPP